MYILIGNYGNETVALLQWVIEQSLTPCRLVSVDTQWAAHDWLMRVMQIQHYARRHEVMVEVLTAGKGFAHWVAQKKEFPTRKFQWCAGILKGLPLNAWLDDIDPLGQATILMGKLKVGARAYQRLSAVIEESEHFGDRKLWFPLFEHSVAERDQLIERAGFPLLKHRSLECEPCIHATKTELANLAAEDIQKTVRLEALIQQPMFTFAKSQGIQAVVQWAQQAADESIDQSMEAFTMGCGSPWGCGE
ncbi:MAG: hypothetical protein GKR77_04460 [Legionellales bacterium]|nr:hypothetical protein [Legionellales bacterium]